MDNDNSTSYIMHSNMRHSNVLISILGPPPLELIKLGKRSAEWFDGDGK
jgi:hypothetical protein